MSTSKHLPPPSAVIALVTCLGFCACGSTVASKPDSSASGGKGGASGASGSGGTGTTSSGGNRADVAVGTADAGGAWELDAPLATGGIGQTGGNTGTGGTWVVDAPLDTGGKTGTGGFYVDGGVLGTGGKTGTGGGTGAGGGTAIDAGSSIICGGLMGAHCAADQFCDYTDHCGMINDSPGFCVPAGPDVVCDAVYAPVCGCNGTTYANECERGKSKVRKLSDGPCVEGRDASAETDRNAGLAWQAAALGSSTGPGIIVMGRGFYAAGTDTLYGSPNKLISDPIPSASLTNAQLDDLFARLAAIDLSALPHATSDAATCGATLIFFTCGSCARQTLSYASSAQLAPDMEPVWAWFDQTLGSATDVTNPRTYCAR